MGLTPKLLFATTYGCNIARHGIKVHNYHVDNEGFADKAFMADVQEKGKQIAFCMAYAHFQNGIAEKEI